MAKVMILYYSSYGHVEALAHAAAEGVAQAGAEPAIRRVPEIVSPELAAKSGYKLDQRAPLASVDELADYDAILFGTPTRFGLMAAQMKCFLDQLGGVWARNLLVGKVGGVFTSTGSQHGGQEATLLSTHIPLLHLGMIVVGLPYTFDGQNRMDAITGGSPYGASTMAPDGQAGNGFPAQSDLDGARFQGGHVARIAMRLARAPQAQPA